MSLLRLLKVLAMNPFYDMFESILKLRRQSHRSRMWEQQETKGTYAQQEERRKRAEEKRRRKKERNLDIQQRRQT